ncbi:hypothetical protein VPH35_066668 [Triticum aestivum]|uniref:Uncharacterized protein n=1 Tax=Triticum urartu TaxID=4572 RepID=A0A8R7U5S5_TRIUA
MTDRYRFHRGPSRPSRWCRRRCPLPPLLAPQVAALARLRRPLGCLLFIGSHDSEVEATRFGGTDGFGSTPMASRMRPVPSLWHAKLSSSRSRRCQPRRAKLKIQ